MGKLRYPDATRLMITADAGGSNGYRSRVFKTELANLAATIGGVDSRLVRADLDVLDEFVRLRERPDILERKVGV